MYNPIGYKKLGSDGIVYMEVVLIGVMFEYQNK